MHLKPHSPYRNRWKFLSRFLLLPILLIYLIPISTLCILMHSWSSTSRDSFRITPCPPLLWPIYHLIPPVFQHPSHLTFHFKSLPQLQIIPTGTLQVTYPKAYHLNCHQTTHIRSLSQIHPLLPVNFKVLIPPYIHSHPKGCHIFRTHKIHLIILSLILHHPQVYFCLQLLLWYPSLHYQICLVYCQP